MLFVFPSCDWLKNIFSPNSPDDPIDPYIPTEFEREVKVTYIRDPSKITNPTASDWLTSVCYKLYDPEHEHNSSIDATYYDEFRMGAINMTKIGENKFEAKLEWVLIQSDPSHKKHAVFIQDIKLLGGGQSEYTTDGTAIQNSYEIEIINKEIRFKQSKIQ